MKNKNQNTNTTPSAEEIKDVDTAQLDNVTGGCAACGMANCTMGTGTAGIENVRARRLGWC